MYRWLRRRPEFVLLGGVVLGALIVGGVFWLQSGLDTTSQAEKMTAEEAFPTAILHATGSHGGDQFALATGPVDSDAEGLYILDYLTGDLHCVVMSSRSGPNGPKFIGHFKTNVLNTLGIAKGKKPDYLMVTGQINFAGAAGAGVRPAESIVYVADGATGNVAAYGFNWSRTMATQFQTQGGAMLPLDGFKARQANLGQ